MIRIKMCRKQKELQFTPKKGVKEKFFKKGSFLEGFAERKLE